jgi:hypothetical protein
MSWLCAVSCCKSSVAAISRLSDMHLLLPLLLDDEDDDIGVNHVLLLVSVERKRQGLASIDKDDHVLIGHPDGHLHQVEAEFMC